MREYCLDDTYHLHRIAFLSLNEIYMPEIFVHFHSQWPAGQIVVCTNDNVPVAFVSSVKTAVSARIMILAVAPEYRSRGIGSKLLEVLRSRATAECISGLTLEVRENNTRAIDFYTKHGFVITDMLESFYNDGGNALRMVQLNI